MRSPSLRLYEIRARWLPGDPLVGRLAVPLSTGPRSGTLQNPGASPAQAARAAAVMRFQYGGDFTLYTVEHGALVKYTPELQTKNMFETEINSFVRCVRTGEKLPSHIDTAVLTSQIMQAIYDSAETHREVVL